MSLLAAGDSLDRYTIVGLLGTGGMGAVYKAVDPRLQREIALKVLRLDFANATSEVLGEGKASLLREARAAAALEHPNVVTIYDVAEAGTPYLAMELVCGKSLRDASVSADMATRVRWLTDVARALAAAHRRGLLHRDVKPSNVMVRNDGVVKVLDFGIAKRIAPRVSKEAETVSASLSFSTTEGGHLVGTPSYLAPEQLRGDPVIDARVDQFAWGVTAYEILCGTRPWQHAPDSVHLVAEILSREPAAPRDVDGAIPEHVSAVVLRAMAKSAHDRFASTDDLVRALEAGVLEEPPARADVRAAPPIERRSVPMVAAVGAVLVGAGALLLAARMRQPAQASAEVARLPAPSSAVDQAASVTLAASASAETTSSAAPTSSLPIARTAKPVPANVSRAGKPVRAQPSSNPPLFFPDKR